jgi:hypothetical protein
MFNTGATLPEYATVQVGVIVTQTTSSKLQYMPPKEDIYLTAGSYRDIEFGIKNIWAEKLTDLEVSLSTSTPYINVVDGQIYSREKLEVNDSLTLSPRLYIGENALPTDYMLTATAYYQDMEGNRYHQSFNIPMTLESVGPPRVTRVTIDNIKTEPNSIQPGDQFTLTLDVEANGAMAYDVTATLIFSPMDPLSPLTPTVIRLGDIGSSEKKKVNYRLLVDGAIPAGQYPLTVTMSYTSSKGIPAAITETVTILVEGIIDFDLLERDLLELVRGEESEIDLNLLLIGTQSVRFVDIELLPDQVFSELSGGEEYIGAVDPDSPIPFDLNVNVEDDATLGEHVMKLRVSYTDHLNQRHEDDLQLTLNIVEPTQVLESQTGLRGFWLWLRRLFGLTP